jgi:hypothetical protein
MAVAEEEMLAKIEDSVFRIESTGKNLEQLQRESLKVTKNIQSMLVFFTILAVLSLVVGLVPIALGLVPKLLGK